MRPPIDTEIAKLRGWRYGLFWLFVFMHDVFDHLPVLMLRRNRFILREKAAVYDILTKAYEDRGREIGRLRAMFRINMLRDGHSEADIAEVLGELHVIGERAQPNKLANITYQ